MSTKITYNGEEIANFSNDTKILQCANKIMDTNLSVTDEGTPTGTINITTNGTHDVAAYASADVNVPGSDKGGDYDIIQTINGDASSLAIRDATPFSLESKTATANGTVTPDSGYDGLSQVTVALPVYDGTVV